MFIDKNTKYERFSPAPYIAYSIYKNKEYYLKVKQVIDNYYSFIEEVLQKTYKTYNEFLRRYSSETAISLLEILSLLYIYLHTNNEKYNSLRDTTFNVIVLDIIAKEKGFIQVMTRYAITNQKEIVVEDFVNIEKLKDFNTEKDLDFIKRISFILFLSYGKKINNIDKTLIMEQLLKYFNIETENQIFSYDVNRYKREDLLKKISRDFRIKYIDRYNIRNIEDIYKISLNENYLFVLKILNKLFKDIPDIKSKFGNKTYRIRNIDIEFAISTFFVENEFMLQGVKKNEKGKLFYKQCLIDEDDIEKMSEAIIQFTFLEITSSFIVSYIYNVEEKQIINNNKFSKLLISDLKEELKGYSMLLEAREREIDELESKKNYIKNTYIPSLEKDNIKLKNKYLKEKAENNDLKKRIKMLEEYIDITDSTEKKDIGEKREISKEEILDKTKDKNLVFIGGNSKIHNKIIELIPNLKTISFEDLAFDTKLLDNTDCIYIFTPILSHAMFYKAINYIRINSLRYKYINNTSVEIIIQEIIDL